MRRQEETTVSQVSSRTHLLSNNCQIRTLYQDAIDTHVESNHRGTDPLLCWVTAWDTARYAGYGNRVYRGIPRLWSTTI
jgi:hypothetical protein